MLKSFLKAGTFVFALISGLSAMDEVPTPEDRSSIQIWVKEIATGKETPISVSRQFTILQFKDLVYIQLGIPVPLQRLILGQEQLKDLRTISSYDSPDHISLVRSLPVTTPSVYERNPAAEAMLQILDASLTPAERDKLKALASKNPTITLHEIFRKLEESAKK
jgi:hypothetical protein